MQASGSRTNPTTCRPLPSDFMLAWYCQGRFVSKKLDLSSMGSRHSERGRRYALRHAIELVNSDLLHLRAIQRHSEVFPFLPAVELVGVVRRANLPGLAGG